MVNQTPTSQTGTLSALEKARILKSQKIEEKTQTEEQIKKQKLEEEKTAQDIYQTTKEEIGKLQGEREKLLTELEETKNSRKENISTQRAAVKELVGSEDGMEIMKDKVVKKEIFVGDEVKLEEIKHSQARRESLLKELDSKISSLEARSKEEFLKTPEGVKEKLKEEVSLLQKNLEGMKAESAKDFPEGNLLYSKINLANQVLSALTQKEAEAGEFLDSPIVKIKRQNGDWITSAKIGEHMKRIEDIYDKDQSLRQEKIKLENENKQATLGIGNGARKKRMDKIDQERKELPSNEERSRDWEKNVYEKDSIFKKVLNFDNFELNDAFRNFKDSGEPLKNFFDKERKRNLETITQTEKLKVAFDKKQEEIKKLEAQLEEKKQATK